jgi:hypothetical protein
MRIQNTPGETSAWIFCSYWLIQGKVNLIGGAKCCFMRIQNEPGVAQCSFKIWTELLYFIT